MASDGFLATTIAKMVSKGAITPDGARDLERALSPEPPPPTMASEAPPAEYCCPACSMPGTHVAVMVCVREIRGEIEYVGLHGDHVYSWRCPWCHESSTGAPSLIRDEYKFKVRWHSHGGDSMHDAAALVAELTMTLDAMEEPLRALARLAAGHVIAETKDGVIFERC